MKAIDCLKFVLRSRRPCAEFEWEGFRLVRVRIFANANIHMFFYYSHARILKKKKTFAFANIRNKHSVVFSLVFFSVVFFTTVGPRLSSWKHKNLIGFRFQNSIKLFRAELLQ